MQILELEPGIAHLGTSFDEAAELQSAHNDVIKNLQSKQSPVEDLLRQADDLIANQKPKAEVYTAMAESLGLAWRDLNSNLDLRKGVLDQNFNFQGHYEVGRDCKLI
jgi:titin